MNKKAVLADGGKEGELRWQLPARLSRQRLRRFFRITFKATPNQKKLTFKSRNAVLTLTVFKLCFSKNVFSPEIEFRGLNQSLSVSKKHFFQSTKSLFGEDKTKKMYYFVIF